MALRWRPKYAEVDAENPQAWGQCDRCGFIWPRHKLQWQMAYQGASQPQNTRFLVCPNHIDPLNPQDSPIILSPDPVPVMNARPGATDTFGEASYLITDDGSLLVTDDDTPIGTQIPDPNDGASTSSLYCSILAPLGDVSVMYLDLFDGDPLSTGRSVLSAITGSSTRTDVASSLTTTAGIATNPDVISIATSSAAQTNVNFAGFYTASQSGALIMSGAVSVSRVIAAGNPVRFAGLGLTINLN